MKKLFRQVMQLFLFVLAIISGIGGINTMTFSSKQIPIDPVEKIPLQKKSIDRFSQALRFQTISSQNSIDTSAFLALDSFLHQSYPFLDTLLEEVDIVPHSKVFKWSGKNSKLSPILLTGHLDLVPIESSSLAQWEYPPFEGRVTNEFIWGRGTLDDKITIISILEAIDKLLDDGYQPERTIYLAFGHDEEIGGFNGAAKIAAYFKKKNIQFEFVLDEGLIILKEALPGLAPPLGMIGITEKGYVSLTLTAQPDNGGHSAMPPKDNAISLLGLTIARLRENPFPAKIDGATLGLFQHAGPEMGLLYKVLFGNLWLTKGLLTSQLSDDPASNAIIRTTMAPTILRAGQTENVLPAEASVLINIRILPGETIESVVDYVKNTIDDERVNVEIANPAYAQNPSAISSIESFGFEVIQKTTQQIFPKTIVAPALVVGVTDARHYAAVSENIYRFLPVQVDKLDLKRIHGINERVSIENYMQCIRFYHQLMLNSSR